MSERKNTNFRYSTTKSKQCLLMTSDPINSVLNNIIKYTLFFERNT